MKNLKSTIAIFSTIVLIVQGNPFFSNQILKSFQPATPPPCNICANRGITRCPNEVLKAENKVNAEESPSLQPRRLENPEKDGIFDLMLGILKTMHASSKADMRRARDKELEERMLLEFNKELNDLYQ